MPNFSRFNIHFSLHTKSCSGIKRERKNSGIKRLTVWIQYSFVLLEGDNLLDEFTIISKAFVLILQRLFKSNISVNNYKTVITRLRRELLCL